MFDENDNWSMAMVGNDEEEEKGNRIIVIFRICPSLSNLHSQIEFLKFNGIKLTLLLPNVSFCCCSGWWMCVCMWDFPKAPQSSADFQ